MQGLPASSASDSWKGATLAQLEGLLSQVCLASDETDARPHGGRCFFGSLQRPLRGSAEESKEVPAYQFGPDLI